MTGPPGTAVQFAAEPAQIAWANGFDCGSLGAGPSVTVEVGPAGLVAVYAEAFIQDTIFAGGVEVRLQLHEPTDLPGCETMLSTTADNAELRRTAPGQPSGTLGRGSWLVFRATPGTRTYSLYYGRSGAGGGFAIWSERRLWVMPL